MTLKNPSLWSILDFQLILNMLEILRQLKYYSKVMGSKYHNTWKTTTLAVGDPVSNTLHVLFCPFYITKFREYFNLSIPAKGFQCLSLNKQGARVNIYLKFHSTKLSWNVTKTELLNISVHSHLRWRKEVENLTGLITIFLFKLQIYEVGFNSSSHNYCTTINSKLDSKI